MQCFQKKVLFFAFLQLCRQEGGIGSKIRFPLFFHSQIFHLKKGIIAFYRMRISFRTLQIQLLKRGCGRILSLLFPSFLHMLYKDLYFLISKSANLSPNLRLLLRFYGYQRSAVMCPSNCSAPIPPPLPVQPRDQKKNGCDEKGRGTRKKGEFSDYIGRGKEKIK